MIDAARVYRGAPPSVGEHVSQPRHRRGFKKETCYTTQMAVIERFGKTCPVERFALRRPRRRRSPVHKAT